MARPCKIPENPEVLTELIEYLAFGLPQNEIAKKLQVHESTVSKWKTRKDISSLLATRTLQVLIEPAKALAKANPGLFLQTHPSTRETFAPPTQKSETKNQHEITCLKIEFIEPNGKNPTTE